MKNVAWMLLVVALGPAYAAEPAQDVVACMRKNVPETVRVDALALAVYDRKGATQTLTGRLYALHEKPKPGAGFMHAMLRLDGPAQLQGAAYLVRETDDYLRDGMFVYLPSVGRVRRVTGTFADGSLLGTSFSYFDFKQFVGAFGDLEPTLEPEQVVDGHAAYVLSFKALPNVETRYSAVRLWVDRKSCVALQADFYEGDTVRKHLAGNVATLTQSNGYWYLSEVEMRDLADGSRTVLRMEKVTSGAALPGRYFDPTSFFLGN